MRLLSRLAILALVLGSLGPAWGQAPEPGRPRRDYRRPTTRPSDNGSGVQPARPVTTPQPSGVAPIAPSPSPAAQPVSATLRSADRPLVELEIMCDGHAWGSVVVELYPERVPVTVQNFLQYVDEGFYDGTVFHRILPGFVVQGGGYVSLTEAKRQGLHDAIRNESRRAPRNTRGTVAMARARDPHSATSQFFVNLVDNDTFDFPKAGTFGYCVFGKVIEGLDIVDRLATVPTRVSEEAARRFARYQATGRQVTTAEKSEPLSPPLIRRAHRLERAEYEQRYGHPAAVAQPDRPAGVSVPIVNRPQPPSREAQPLPQPQPQPQPQPAPVPPQEPQGPDEPAGEPDE